MSEFVEVFKMVLENPSPLVICVVVPVLVIYKSRDLLDIFFQLKDINKKRIIQRLEETKTLSEKNYLDSSLNRNYDRLCEEAQIHAIIGCRYCSKEMAKYILTRKNISRAIRIYHRVKDNVEVKDGKIIPITPMKNWRIKLNSYGGIFFYISFILLGAAPFILVMMGKLFKVNMSLSSSYYLDAFIIFSLFFIMGFISLYQSLKPEFSALFCELEANEIDLIICDSEDKAA